MEAKTYTISGYTLNEKNWVEIIYQVDSCTQKFIILDKAEHQVQFVDLLSKAGYTLNE